MHDADKPKLVEGLQKFSSSDFTGLEENVQYIIDGGDLLFKMGKWKKQKSYQLYSGSICIVGRKALWE